MAKAPKGKNPFAMMGKGKDPMAKMGKGEEKMPAGMAKKAKGKAKPFGKK